MEALMTSRFGPPVAEARPYQLKVTDRVQSLRDEWLALGERVRHPFATCDWLSLWRWHFGRPRHRLTLICAPGSDGQLLGAVHRPFCAAATTIPARSPGRSRAQVRRPACMLADGAGVTSVLFQDMHHHAPRAVRRYRHRHVRSTRIDTAIGSFVRRAQPYRPNVLIIVQNLSVPLDRRVWMECQGLRRAGYGVSVICPRFEGDTVFQELDGVQIYRYRPAPAASGLLSYASEFLYCWLATALLSVKVAKRDGLAAIQTCNPPDTYWALAWPYKFFGDRVFVYDQHDLSPEVYRSRFPDGSRVLERLLLLFEGLNYRVADHVIVTNDAYRAIALDRGHRRTDQVTVVRSGPLTSVMKPGPADPGLGSLGPHLCCYLGVMGPQDGVDLLLQSWRVLVQDLGRTDAHLALLGFGDCYEDLRGLARELGITEHVTFTGRVGPDELERYLRSAQIGLSPDPLNPLNDVSTMNKTMEYMA
jgi:glycosyltransferase involved in cell wall biosynthesis